MGILDLFKTKEKPSVTLKTQDKDKIGSSSSASFKSEKKDDQFKAYIPQFLYKPHFGYPLRKNVPMLKELARNPYIFSVIRTLKDEASSQKYEIRVKKEFQDKKTDYSSHIKNASMFFYNPNGNAESFGDILGQWVQDLCELDSAVGVKVFNRRGKFSQLFARDGGSFLKNPDIFGYMGNRADFVFPIDDDLRGATSDMPDKLKLYSASYGEQAGYFQYGWTGAGLPVPFGKREIIYIMSNPRSDSIYGRSPLEVIGDVLMALVYGVRYNLDFYTNGNMPDGIVHLANADTDVCKAFQDRLKEKFQVADTLGNDVRQGHVYPVWGGPEVNFVPFQISAKDMEIIEQQKWFTKLIWSAFGITPDEMGYTEDSNKAVSQAMGSVHKRKALKPLLNKIEYAINTQLMPELDPTGALEFKFEDYDLDEDIKRHSLYKEQIDMGIKSADMVAEEEGIDINRLREDKLRNKELFFNNNSNEDDKDDKNKSDNNISKDFKDNDYDNAPKIKADKEEDLVDYFKNVRKDLLDKVKQ